MPIPRYDGSRVIGYTVNHGERSSDICLRIYDKGLKSSGGCSSYADQWIRWEAEFKGDKGDSVFRHLMEDLSPEAIQAHAKSCITRIDGPSKRLLEYMPEAPLSAPPNRSTADLDGYIKNLRHSFMPRLTAIGEGLGIPALEVLALLVGKDPISVSRQVRKHPVIPQAIQFLTDSRP